MIEFVSYELLMHLILLNYYFQVLHKNLIRGIENRKSTLKLININMPRHITLTTYRGVTMPSTVYSDHFFSPKKEINK